MAETQESGMRVIDKKASNKRQGGKEKDEPEIHAKERLDEESALKEDFVNDSLLLLFQPCLHDNCCCSSSRSS
jgi:hypothetical protein